MYLIKLVVNTSLVYANVKQLEKLSGRNGEFYDPTTKESCAGTIGIGYCVVVDFCPVDNESEHGFYPVPDTAGRRVARQVLVEPGLGGAAGMYLGARAQKYIPATAIKLILCAVILFTAARYLTAYLG